MRRPSYGLFAAVTLVLIISSTTLHAQLLEVHFINLGHGDCTLITTPQGTTVLIDAGLSIMTWKLKRYLKRHEVTTIDLLVLTHAHRDHYGGMKGVIKTVTVKEFVDPGTPSSRETLESLYGLVKKRGLRRTIARRGTTFTLGDVTLEVLSPPVKLLEDVRSVENANSIVLRVTYKNVRLLLAGDIERETEAILLKEGVDLKADLLKVPHHGISTSSTPAFIEAVNPRYAVITCAYYAEPSRKLYDRFEKRGITWFRNDANGTIVFRLADPTAGTFAVAYERGEKNSRLKVTPDWYKLLQQVTAIPEKARHTWETEIYQEAKPLAEKIEKAYKKNKAKIKQLYKQEKEKIKKAYKKKKEELLKRLPGIIKQRLHKKPPIDPQPVPEGQASQG